MPRINSPYWDEELGVCTKHGIPSLPCPACMAGNGDEDVEFRFTETDIDVVVAENLMNDTAEQPLTLRDLIPANFRNPVMIV